MITDNGYVDVEDERYGAGIILSCGGSGGNGSVRLTAAEARDLGATLIAYADGVAEREAEAT